MQGCLNDALQNGNAIATYTKSGYTSRIALQKEAVLASFEGRFLYIVLEIRCFDERQ